jgi:hypothetical protein
MTVEINPRRSATMLFVLGVDFTIFPDNTVLGPSFTLADMDFQDIPGGPNSFVNETAGERALQFPDTGLEIDLPLAVPWVRMRVGQFASPYTIEALDTKGTTVAVFSHPFPNSYRNIRLHTQHISLIRFTGGRHW